MGLCDATHLKVSPVSSPGTEGPKPWRLPIWSRRLMTDWYKSLKEVVDDTLATMFTSHEELSAIRIANSEYKLEELQDLSAAVGKNLHHKTEELARLNDAIEYNTRRREEAKIFHAKTLAAMHEAIAAEANALKELTCILDLLAELGITTIRQIQKRKALLRK